MNSEEGEVRVTRDILLNPGRILPAGTRLRTCFEPPAVDSAEVRRKETRQNLEQTFSRKPITVSSQDVETNAYREAVKEKAFNVIWENPDLFRGFFHKVPYDRYYLVYQLNPQAAPEFDQFQFPDGLFFAAGEETVDVLAVETKSRAEAAGFRAGDRIHLIDGQAFRPDLKTFMGLYLELSERQKQDSRPLTFEVSREDQPERFQRVLRLPLSLQADPFAPILE